MVPRREKRLELLIVLGIGLGASAASSGPSVQWAEPRVESFEIVSVDSLNARIATAARAGEAWTKDPVRVALEVTVQSSQFMRSLDLRYEGNSGELPDSALVTLVADGYANDSVRGSWAQLWLARQADETWRVIELRRAWRCWRGHHRQSYSKQLCL
jgi:hypothetical protein